MKPRIAISLGDLNGIGPEIILKTIQDLGTKDFTPVIIGSSRVLDYYKRLLNIDLEFNSIEKIDELDPASPNVLECFNDIELEIQPGSISNIAGKCAMRAVEKACEFCIDDKAEAMVTAPISKEAIKKAGYRVPGHTEFLAEKTRSTEYMMLLVNEGLRVGLATIHIPLRRVIPLLNKPNIKRFINIMDRSLRMDFKIESPRIAVLGVNPHASDGGVIGNEEKQIITPAISEASVDGIEVEGPFPADSFFGNKLYQDFDSVLSMYHDQGLIPFKTLSFNKGVNFTAGLPIIRTSPDHGTAFDIAAQNKASHQSFKRAVELAIKLAINRTSDNKHKKEKV